MNSADARELLERLGCRRIRVSGGEIMCSCPFPESHSRGDRRPSFSSAINSEGGSPYFCFACHASGTLEGLAVGNGHVDLVPDWKPKRVQNRSWLSVPSTNAGKFRHLYKQKRKPVLFKDDYLEPFTGVLSGYFKRRGILLETARAWELGLDKWNQRAIIPVRDYEGRLALVIGRDVTGKSYVKYSNYVLDRKNKRMVPFIDHSREDDFISPLKSYVLYGEHKAWRVAHGESDRCSDDLVVVEGALDTLMLWQYGWNAVAILGSKPSDVQIEKLITLVPRKKKLIVMGDGDKAGRMMTEELGRKIGGRIPVFDAKMGDGKDPGESTKDEIADLISRCCFVGLTVSG